MTAELAKRAVACAGWRWLPGMLMVGATVPARFPWSPGDPVLSCMPIRVTSVDGEGYPWGTFSTGESGGWGRRRDGLPDLTDPATRGCLLDLVRQAWGDHRDFRIGTGRRLLTQSRYACVEVWENGSLLHEFFGDSEAKALVVALESAP